MCPRQGGPHRNEDGRFDEGADGSSTGRRHDRLTAGDSTLVVAVPRGAWQSSIGQVRNPAMVKALVGLCSRQLVASSSDRCQWTQAPVGQRSRPVRTDSVRAEPEADKARAIS